LAAVLICDVYGRWKRLGIVEKASAPDPQGSSFWLFLRIEESHDLFLLFLLLASIKKKCFSSYTQFERATIAVTGLYCHGIRK
jgi:hypothetical protein